MRPVSKQACVELQAYQKHEQNHADLSQDTQERRDFLGQQVSGSLRKKLA